MKKIRFGMLLLPWITLMIHAQERPNVLFIAIDDLRPELGCYGSRAITPNIDRLAGSGLRFDRAYCNQAVCGASRVSLMTSLYPEFTNERTYHVGGWRKRWENIVTLNQHFTDNDYTTVGLGKIYHRRGGDGADLEHWSEWLVFNQGKLYADPKSLELTRVSKRKSGQNSKTKGPATESIDVPSDTYKDQQLALEGARQIQKLAASGQPFFLAVGFEKPHLPFNAPKKFWNLYERESFTLPENVDIPPGYPHYASNRRAGELRGYADIPRTSNGPGSIFSMELNQRLMHGYMACVSYVDYNVGILLDALEQEGLVDNTVVVLWGDHGWKLGEHGSWCKHTNFEVDTRVPLIMRYPGMRSARGATQALVEFVDLYPTLSELCGLDAPPHVQGQSFLPVLKDPSAPHREFAYSSYPHNNPELKASMIGHSIRNQQYRYTEWWRQDNDQVVDRALTDLAKDPGETTSLLPDETSLADELSLKLKRRVLDARRDRNS